MIEQAQSNLAALLHQLVPGDQLEIVENGIPLAVVTRASENCWPSEPGSAKDREFWMSPDFDEPLEDFEEFMK